MNFFKYIKDLFSRCLKDTDTEVGIVTVVEDASDVVSIVQDVAINFNKHNTS